MRTVSKNKKFALQREGTLDVVAWSDVEAHEGDAVYAEFVEKSVAHNTKLGPPQAFFIFNPTFVPNVKQRALLGPAEDKLRYRDVKKIAIVSDTASARGAATAIQWTVKTVFETQSFPRDEVMLAFSWLQRYVEFDLARARKIARELIHEVGWTPPDTL